MLSYFGLWAYFVFHPFFNVYFLPFIHITQIQNESAKTLFIKDFVGYYRKTFFIKLIRHKASTYAWAIAHVNKGSHDITYQDNAFIQQPLYETVIESLYKPTSHFTAAATNSSFYVPEWFDYVTFFFYYERHDFIVDAIHYIIEPAEEHLLWIE